MKLIGQYTTRGRIAHLTEKKLELFDGRFDTAFKVVSFQIAPFNFSSAADTTALGRLATEDGRPLVRESFWDFADNTQVAWTAINGEGFEAYPQADQTIIDPTNLIVEDLYITCLNGDDVDTNYIISFEKYDISEWMGALQLVRNAA